MNDEDLIERVNDDNDDYDMGDLVKDVRKSEREKFKKMIGERISFVSEPATKDIVESKETMIKKDVYKLSQEMIIDELNILKKSLEEG